MPRSVTTQRGDSQVIVYLGGVTEDQVCAIEQACADACADQGLGCRDDQVDSQVVALVGVRAEPFPNLDDADVCVEFLSAHHRFLIPSARGTTPGELALLAIAVLLGIAAAVTSGPAGWLLIGAAVLASVTSLVLQQRRLA